MNLILLENENTRQLVPVTSLACKHLLEIVHLGESDTFWCGVKNGSRGLATIEKIVPSGLEISIKWESENTTLGLPATILVIGLSRPQTMKKVLANAAELGVQKICVFVSENTDPSYAQSSLWREGNNEIEAIFTKAAEQTCTTNIPELQFFNSLADALKCVPAGVVFDVYEKSVPANEVQFGVPATFAIGSERGWTARERELFRGNAWQFAHLGARVLRVETAATFAHALALASLKNWQAHKTL